MKQYLFLALIPKIGVLKSNPFCAQRPSSFCKRVSYSKYIRGVFISKPDDLNKRKTVMVRAISIFSFYLHGRWGS
jgi:hypothetical protein